MTKTMKLITVFFASMLIFGTSCGKYEDGPSLSLRSKKARLVNTWEIEEATDADDDVTAGYAGATWTLDKDGNYTTGGTITSTGAAVPEIKGKWEFSSDKTKLILTPENVTLPTKWTITRLKNDELWLKDDQAQNTSKTRKFKGLD